MDDPGILRMITYCTEMLSVNEDVQIVMKKIKGNSCKLLQVSEYAQSVFIIFNLVLICRAMFKYGNQ